MSSPISCEGLTKKFFRTAALEKFTWELPEGSIFALIGANGAGKTTLIKMLVNLIRPTAGRAVVLGRDSQKLAAADLASIGYVSDNQKLPGWMTLDYLLSYLKPFYPTWDDDRAGDLVREFDLPRDRKISNFSRGMKMKAALCSSLAYHPRLILLDEPFSGLDALARDEFIQGLLQHTENSTVLVSSHDLAELETFASHVGFLHRGRMQFSEEVTTLHERFREVEVTLRGVASVPSIWPSGWLKPETSSALIRFVDTQFDRERTSAQIVQLFPDALSVSVNPIALRDIFIALAKANLVK